MKNLLSLSCILGFLLMGPFTVSAQNATVGTTTSTTIDLASLDYRYNAVLEFFLQKTSEKDFETAYGLTSGNFQKQNPKERFIKIITDMGLTDFTSKKWTSFKDQMGDIGVTTVEGEFTQPDGTVHKLTFYTVIGGETEIKIGALAEELTPQVLVKRMPTTPDLHKLVLKDLKKITYFIRTNKGKNAYRYLSPSAQQRTTLKDVRKAFRTFRKQKLNLTLPKKGQIVLADGFPAVSADNLMVVQGTYVNGKNQVTFLLGYDYEWEWKLGFFSFNAAPLAAANGPAPAPAK